MSRWVLLAAAALFACGGGDDSESDTGGNGGNGGNGDFGTVLDLIEPELDVCVEFETSEGLICRDIEGAERYLAADIRFEGDDAISGRFFVVLFANDAWRETSDWQNSPAADGYMCQVAFGLSGTRSIGGGDSCGACDISLSYNIGSRDNSLTTCPGAYADDVARDVEGISDAYWGVELRSDGSAVGWDTQRAWAPNGEHSGAGVKLWSDWACQWYGSGECT